MWMSQIRHMYRKKNKVKEVGETQDKYAMKDFIVVTANVASGH